MREMISCNFGWAIKVSYDFNLHNWAQFVENTEEWKQ